MHSKPVAEIVAEARELIEDGAVELNLIGQDTTSYGSDIGDERVAVGVAGHGGLPFKGAGERVVGLFGGALEALEVDVDQAEALVVAFRPLEVVHD